MADVDAWNEPLKSVTFVKLATPDAPSDASHAQPFHLSCASDLSSLYCCASADGQVIVFPDDCPPQQVEMPVPPHVSFVERGAGSDVYVGIASASQAGSSVRRVQLTMRSNTSSSIATGGELVAGGKGRGFQDGPREVALFHSPSVCAVHTASRRTTLAVADRGNFAIRLIDVTPGERFGRVRTVCGCGVPGYNDGPQDESMLRDVTGMLWTSEGHLIFSDGANHAIRLLRRRQESPGSDLFLDSFDALTVLGGLSKREGLMDGPLVQALCHRPCGLSVGPTEQYVLFADSGNNAIRLIDLTRSTVSTIASTADYEPGSPVPQGLVDVSQVFTVALKDGIGAHSASSLPPVSVVCTSQSQRAISMIVATTLPLPSRKSGHGVVGMGSLYQLVTDRPVCSSVAARQVQLTQRPPQRKATAAMALGSRSKGAYADLETSRRRREAEAQHRTARPVIPSKIGARSPSQNMRSSSSAERYKDPVSADGHQLSDVPDDDAHRNLRVVFEAHASWLHPRDAHNGIDDNSVGMQAADANLSMKRLHYWNFCVMAELTVVKGQLTGQQNTAIGTPCYDLLDELYTHSCKRSGYKTVARMPFQAFADAVGQLYLHTHPRRAVSAGQGRNVPSSTGAAVKHDSKILEGVVQTYCGNAQSPQWRTRQMLLDLMTANEIPLLRIFHAYANDINRQQHVGRIPFLRFQSLLHTLHIYPSLISQYRLKLLFAESLQSSLFFDPSARGAEGAPDDAISSSLTKVQVDTACKEQSMNLFQFLEGVMRVGWACFSTKGKHIQSPKHLARFVVDGDIEHVTAALDNLFRWVNVEVETMEPATETADRHRMSNNEACAVFPPRIPLFECRSSGRSASVASRSDGGDGSPHRLERELRRLRRQEDAVDLV